jgi:hypothetical protein
LPGRRQHYEAIAKGLRPVYTAPTEAAAMERFLEFCETWGERYPAIVRLWENASAEFVPFLGFDVEITLERSTNARSFFGRESPAGCPRDGELDLTYSDAPGSGSTDIRYRRRCAPVVRVRRAR